MKNIQKNNGLPRRTNEQIEELQKLYPNKLITGKIIYEHKNITTEEIKKKETEFIQHYVNNISKHLCKDARLPEGNQSHKEIINFD